MTSLRTKAARAAVLGLAAAASLSVLAATPAHAAGSTTASKSGNILFVTAASGTGNSISLVRNSIGQYDVRDLAGMSAGAGCVQAGPRQVLCSGVGISEVRISAGDQNDRVTLNTSTFSRVTGGTGDDQLRSVNVISQARLSGNDGNDILVGTLSDSLFGQNGNDLMIGGRLLIGGEGNDRMRGLDGNDTMDGGNGFDDLDGGAGFDDLCANAEVTVNCEAF